MLWRIGLSLLLIIAGLLSGQQAPLPLATFSGTVHGVSSKRITIENADGNMVDFEVNRKTRVIRGKKEASISELATGDSVTIEAQQERARYAMILTAVTVTVH
jgi:Cu/Ag efflux protein CusF